MEKGGVPESFERDWFGEVAAIDGETLAVSAIGEDSGATGQDGDQSDNSVQDAGAVYIFRRQDGQWVQEAYLKASNPMSGDLFGESLDLDGDVLVVGSSNKGGTTENPLDTNDRMVGAAYVFEREGGVWTEVAYLRAEHPRPFDRFGFSVGISGNTIVVGAPLEDGNAVGVDGSSEFTVARRIVDSGAAFVFEKRDGFWERTAYLKASQYRPSGRLWQQCGDFGRYRHHRRAIRRRRGYSNFPIWGCLRVRTFG